MGLAEKQLLSNFQVVFNNTVSVEADKIPIYHVHGYTPMERSSTQSSLHELVFSEDQYNTVYQDSYFWGNMVQMQNLASHTGLMVGISLADRNVRRLLDAVKKTPISTRNYLLLKRITFEEPREGSEDMKFIHDKAMEMRDRMENSGVKKETHEYMQVKRIFRDISQYESDTFSNIYRNMGLEVLLYDSHDEIPEFIQEIVKS